MTAKIKGLRFKLMMIKTGTKSDDIERSSSGLPNNISYKNLIISGLNLLCKEKVQLEFPVIICNKIKNFLFIWFLKVNFLYICTD